MPCHFIQTNTELERHLEDIYSKLSLAYDTETTGVDPHKDKVVLMQLGDAQDQYVIDTGRVSVEPLRNILESNTVAKVAHNASFDYKMTKTSFNIEMGKIRDTMLAAKIYEMGRKPHGFGLNDCLRDYLGIEIDKAMQKSFIGHKGEFSDAQIAYAAEDIKPLKALNAYLSKKLQMDGLGDTYVLECAVLPVFAEMELEGLLLDKPKWEGIIKEHEEAAYEVARKLDMYSSKFFNTDIFGNVNINYQSPDQVLHLLKKLRIEQPILDPVTGEIIGHKPLEDTSDSTLKTIKLPIVQLIKKYRTHAKIVSTYGKPFLDAIHPVTGRIHPRFEQLGTETGRPTSHKRSPVNMLNIPRDKRMRNSFIADEDYVIETDDYSGCELRILAHLSQDKNFVEPLVRGEDLHCSVATALYGVPVTKKNENSKLRTPAKNLNFGIIYGMGPSKLCVDINAQNFDLSLEGTKKLFNKYCATYKDAVDYVRECGKNAVANGYATNPNGRRRYWIRPDPHDRGKFPGGKEDKKYRGVLSSIERQGGNYPIQSTNADITKYAMVLIHKYIKANNIRSKIILQVYDEIVTKTHKDDSEEFHKAKVRLMEEAALRWVDSVPIEIEGDVLPYWTK